MSEMGRPRETAPIGYVTVSEAAALLGVTVQAIYNRIKAGTIPYEKSLKRNGQSCYYLSQEWIEQEKKEKAGRVQRAPEAQTNLDDISEHLAALSEGQEELQQAVREILAATQTDAPRASSDEPKPAVGNTARGEGNGQRIPYERADDP